MERAERQVQYIAPRYIEQKKDTGALPSIAIRHKLAGWHRATSMCGFHVGQKVVCIDDTGRVALYGLTRGRQYTIQEITRDKLAVRLEEIILEPGHAFWSHRFILAYKAR